jgi:ATP-dependent DNA helicase PIF1
LSEQILELSEEFNITLDMMELTNHHLFITGRAGTGKSTLLQLFRNTSKKNMVVLAPTGVAALNVKGQTIHSFFGLPPRLINRHDIHKKRKNERTLLKKLQTVIIDEISMVRAEMLDNIDYVLRLNREVDEPFGGVQMIFFGDLFQLPPIVSTEEEKSFFKTHYKSAYFFSSHIIREIDLKTLELTKIYRQTSRRFIKLLECIRTGSVDYDELEELNERYGQQPEFEKSYITLSTRNAVVDSLNNSKLAAIDEVEFLYNAIITGAFDPRIYPVEAGLKLKKGAQVMFLKNDPQKKYVNGTI